MIPLSTGDAQIRTGNNSNSFLFQNNRAVRTVAVVRTRTTMRSVSSSSRRRAKSMLRL